MSQPPGLRERKKEQTRRALWQAAMTLFLERGFDNVSVAEIAAAANVSKMTVFNYFPTKEDLIMSPMEEHVGDLARMVRERGPGESAVAAVRRGYLAALGERDASTGLNDSPSVLDLQRLMLATPALLHRMYASVARIQGYLAQELAVGGNDITAQVAAAQIVATCTVLTGENLRRLLAGESPETVQRDALTNARHAFHLLESGLGDYPA